MPLDRNSEYDKVKRETNTRAHLLTDRGRGASLAFVYNEGIIILLMIYN